MCFLTQLLMSKTLCVNSGQAGGPFYEIPKGRKDGRRSKIEDTINLPPPFFNSSDLINMFGKHGFNVQELVALSGKFFLLLWNIYFWDYDLW